jgi:hypothetical protein
MRSMLVGLFALTVLTGWVSAQAPVAPRLRWQPGQILVYHVEHITNAADTMADSRSETKSLLRVSKRWQVTEVDAAGTATLQLSLTAMLQERTTPSGDVLRYDSANPDKSTPQLKDALSHYLNTPLATIRVDALGRVVQVKASKSDASSYENELPFLCVLPTAAVKPGDSWERSYQITLAPPLGTGEKYNAVQRYTCKELTADQMTVTLVSELKNSPTGADAVPLWQFLPQGEVSYDLKAGRLHSAKLHIYKEIKNHQGDNSSCTFSSTMTVQYAGDR